jgi:hypothetical protein
MADQAKIGTPWQEDELDAIVADYFAMLTAELAGQAYTKSRHGAALMAKIGRTHRSVEFKHQNISAVLDELGMPWISGYIPKRNYQNAIFGAIDRYLSQHPEILEFVPPPRPVATILRPELFVPPPAMTPAEMGPEGLRRLVHKFDPIERDQRNRSLGRAGEEFVLDVERQQLKEMNRPDLASKVRWVAADEGDGAGYDIHSFDPQNGSARLIEVKTTNGSARTPFFLSRNERNRSTERPAEWCIYRVHLFATVPKIFVLAPPLEDSVRLTTEIWRASFGMGSSGLASRSTL